MDALFPIPTAARRHLLRAICVCFACRGWLEGGEGADIPAHACCILSEAGIPAAARLTGAILVACTCRGRDVLEARLTAFARSVPNLGAVPIAASFTLGTLCIVCAFLGWLESGDGADLPANACCFLSEAGIPAAAHLTGAVLVALTCLWHLAFYARLTAFACSVPNLVIVPVAAGVALGTLCICRAFLG